MVTIKSFYVGDLRTEAVHVKSSSKLLTDAPLDNNGKGEAFSPTDLVCAALGSCMMTVMGIRAQRDGIVLEGLEADITKVMSANPRKIAKITVDFRLKSTSASSEQLAMLKEAALTCPVALSLNSEIDQDVSFSF